jgi:hypothetical protein
MSKENYVKIAAGLAGPALRGLTQILEGFLPMRFIESSEDGKLGAGTITLQEGSDQPERNGSTGLIRLSVPGVQALEKAVGASEVKVRFADDPVVPFPFRGRTVVTKVAGGVRELRCAGDEKVMASTDQGPLWVVSSGNGPRHYRSGLAIPHFSAEATLRDVFNGEQFLEILPLLHFLHEVCGSSLLQGPPLRACFIFDDPNLHWPRYGYVDYREVATHAAKENYHVSFATVPLDAWYTHGGTADIFKRNVNRLSLSVHGNDHTKGELGRKYTQVERIALLRQAIRRIERLEHKSGVTVSRVMVPPHGACSEEMLAEIPACGFEAACISHGSLQAHNRTSAWTKGLGYAACEVIRGCPVPPRWGFAGDTTNTILLAAYLNQPLILRGHHQDLKEGIERLDQLARSINGLGRPVHWSNMTDLCRRNYLSRLESNTLRVKPLGRKLAIRIPVEANRLVMDADSCQISPGWKISGIHRGALKAEPGEPVALPEAFDGTVLVETADGPARSGEQRASRTPVRIVLRRLLTEGRDRVQALP